MMESGNGGVNMSMPVAPAYGVPAYGVPAYANGGFGNSFGGDALWLLLFFCIMGGWGNNGYGAGAGGFGGGGLYPWMNQSNQINDGFRDQMINGNITGIQNAVTSGFGDVQLGIAGLGRQICETGNGITGAVRDGFFQSEIAANGRQMADMQQNFALQGQIAQFASDVRLGQCQTQNTIVSDGAQTRETIRSGNQMLMDKLCQLELDNYKNQLADERRENSNLRNQLNMAATDAKFERQNALFQQGMNNEVDALYNRLSNCPVPSIPVYGRTPIFTCNSRNGNCPGCGGNGFLN